MSKKQSAKSPEFVYICSPQDNPDRNCQGSLQGLRLGVKDLFHIANLPTTAGNPHWLVTHPQPAKETASAVVSLLEAGMTLVGKTLTDELAYSLEGINIHYGTPLNHKAPQRLPGGSSSGSAAAVANGSIDLGLGTDTGGSIRVPASYNGLYGMRPSHGIISCEGLIPLAPRFDTVGWMTRDFSTLVAAAKVLLPPDNSDNKLSHLVICNIEGIEPWGKTNGLLLDTIISQFESINYIELSWERLNQASAAFRVLQGREIWKIHGKWIEDEQPNLAPEIRARFISCKSLTAADETDAKHLAQDFIAFWHSKILTTQDSLLLLPTTPGAAPLLHTPASQLLKYRNFLLGMTAPAGLTGAPQITLPYLKSEQAPWGISFLAAPGRDRILLDLVDLLDKKVQSIL